MSSSKKKKSEHSYYTNQYNPPRKSPPVFKAVLIILVVVVSLFGLDYFSGARFFASEGPVSSSHAMFDATCESCHTSGSPEIKKASMEKKCMGCHSTVKQLKFHITSHREDGAKERKTIQKYCVDCHKEHRGRQYMIHEIGDRQCKNCHQISNAQFEHPAFKQEKLEPSDLKNIGLQFSHKTHQVRDKNKEDINDKFKKGCPLCHLYDPQTNFMDFKRVTFQENCQDCHPHEELSITKMFPEEELEGLADSIKSLAVQFSLESHDTFFSRFEYSKGSKRRRRPSSFSYQPIHQDPYLNMWFSEKDFSEEQVRAALSSGRPGATLNCLKCHLLNKGSAKAQPNLKVGKDFYFTPIPKRAPRADITRFPHKKHSRVGCNECHKTISTSESLKDSNINIDNASCFNCHNNVMVGNECGGCHVFHHMLNQSEMAKLMVENSGAMESPESDETPNTNETN